MPGPTYSFKFEILPKAWVQPQHHYSVSSPEAFGIQREELAIHAHLMGIFPPWKEAVALHCMCRRYSLRWQKPGKQTAQDTRGLTGLSSSM